MTTDVGWLVVLAMVTGTNPLRLGGRLPQARVVAVGAGLTFAAYLLLATIARSVLDAIDVSVPTMVVAAGLVLIGGAARDLLLGPPALEPALGGWGAAVVPVAIPMLARPQVAVLAIGAGPEGLGPVVIGGVVATVLVLVVGYRRDPIWLRVTEWASVAASIAAVATGVALAVAGVLAV